MAENSSLGFYESILIFHPETETKDWKEILSKSKKAVEAQSGEWLHTETWGKRPLANFIKKQHSGFYFHCLFKVQPSFITELEKIVRYNEKVLRFLYLRLSDKLSVQPVEKYIESCHEGFKESMNREKERLNKKAMKKNERHERHERSLRDFNMRG